LNIKRASFEFNSQMSETNTHMSAFRVTYPPDGGRLLYFLKNKHKSSTLRRAEGAQKLPRNSRPEPHVSLHTGDARMQRMRRRKKGEFPKGVSREAKHVVASACPSLTYFDAYGPTFFRRACRMEEKSFWKLLDLLEPKMGVKRSRKRGATPNGPVCNIVRLAMALCYYTGGDPLDIALVYHVSRDLK
jgi:hypothetical protein